MIGQLTTAKTISPRYSQNRILCSISSLVYLYRLQDENFETKNIHDEVWCYWEQLVEYMRIWGTTHIHTHTHSEHHPLEPFWQHQNPKQKNHQQVKGS